MHLPIGTQLLGGRYEIVRFINSGGFGCTYEALHTSFKKRVAIKEFFVKDFCNRDETNFEISCATHSKKDLVEKLKEKFIGEASALFDMQHPGIVRVTDTFEENGTAYYVMEYVEGTSLQGLVQERGTLPEEEALGYIRQVCEALRYVHSLNRLHLDIKPGNIMLNKAGKAVLIDFGASKHYDEASGENTSTLMGVNTPGYAPYEQVTQTFTTFNPSTDIYAVGATLYKLLTGITPPDSGSLMAEDKTLPPLPAHISAATARAIEQAMQPKRARRPQTIEEFLALLDTPVVAAQPASPLSEKPQIEDYKNDKTEIEVQEKKEEKSQIEDYKSDKTEIEVQEKKEEKPQIEDYKSDKTEIEENVKKEEKPKEEIVEIPVSPVGGSSRISLEADEEDDEEERGTARKWIVLGVVVVLLSVVAGYLFIRQGSGPKQALPVDSIAQVKKEFKAGVDTPVTVITPTPAPLAEESGNDEGESLAEEEEKFARENAELEKQQEEKRLAEEAKAKREAERKAQEEAADRLAREEQERKAKEKEAKDAQLTPQELYQQGWKHYNAKEYKQAIPLFLQAAEQGHDLAQNNLGLCYDNGWGVDQNRTQAVYWYSEAAKQNNDRAQYNLGLCYYYGEGVGKDYTKAVYWYSEAAKQGNASAQYNLGVCYSNGEGVEKNYTKAVYWYRKAADQGNTSAKRMVKKLEDMGY